MSSALSSPQRWATQDHVPRLEGNWCRVSFNEEHESMAGESSGECVKDRFLANQSISTVTARSKDFLFFRSLVIATLVRLLPLVLPCAKTERRHTPETLDLHFQFANPLPPPSPLSRWLGNAALPGLLNPLATLLTLLNHHLNHKMKVVVIPQDPLSLPATLKPQLDL